MREIHPFNVSVDEALKQAPEIKELVLEIRRQKIAGERAKPSITLIDRSSVMTTTQRAMILDKVAELVDENYCGRSEMCQQFADLMHKSLTHLGYSARIVTGTVTYYDRNGKTLFRWPDDGHEWVLVNDELIDGNVDSLPENMTVPNELAAQPYWGPRKDAPRDRKFHENRGARTRQQDVDVENIWWPELKDWLDQSIR